ncbi:MAG: DUF1045 domain-containing protein [Pseudomonadota bacterium]
MTEYARYALYFTAPGHELAKVGAAWLGWDIAGGAEVAQGAEVSPAWTATPRRYGFHGTLKPPFHLAAGKTAEALTEASAALARRHARIGLGTLAVTQLGGFLALTTQEVSGIARLAGALVTELDEFRAPPSEAELERRRKAGLTARQDEYLQAWGYPYVLDEFRFHMTLTGRLAGDESTAAAALAQAFFRKKLLADVPVAAITLCGERPDRQFEAIETFPLA